MHPARKKRKMRRHNEQRNLRPPPKTVQDAPAAVKYCAAEESL